MPRPEYSLATSLVEIPVVNSAIIKSCRVFLRSGRPLAHHPQHGPIESRVRRYGYLHHKTRTHHFGSQSNCSRIPLARDSTLFWCFYAHYRPRCGLDVQTDLSPATICCSLRRSFVRFRDDAYIPLNNTCLRLCDSRDAARAMRSKLCAVASNFHEQIVLASCAAKYPTLSPYNSSCSLLSKYFQRSPGFLAEEWLHALRSGRPLLRAGSRRLTGAWPTTPFEQTRFQLVAQSHQTRLVILKIAALPFSA